MGTVATATKIAGVSCIGPELYMAIYTVALETTDATGIQTMTPLPTMGTNMTRLSQLVGRLLRQQLYR